MGKPNILIIGASSNVGVSLIKFLKNYNVYIAGIKNADFYFNGLNEFLNNKIIDNTFDIIINTMSAFGGNNVNSFYKTEKINALGMLTVCKLAKITHCMHLVHISSIFKNSCAFLTNCSAKVSGSSSAISAKRNKLPCTI